MNTIKTSHKFNLLFFGSDVFSTRVLDYILRRPRSFPVEVVTKKGTLLHEYSDKNKLPIHTWPIDLKQAHDVHNIGLVASFGHLIEATIVNHFKFGLFNVHPSLLPQYRGSTPVQAAIRDGLKETGCTIMEISSEPKFDIGNIVLQEKLKIKDREYALELRGRLADLGGSMFEKLIENYDTCTSLSKPQPRTDISYSKKLKPEDGLIRFISETSDQIDRKVRAYTGFIDLYSYCLNGLRVKLQGDVDPKLVDGKELDRLIRLKSNETNSKAAPPGSIYFHKKTKLICFKCSDNKWVGFQNVTPVYKPMMTSLEFYNGYISKHLVNSYCILADV